MARRSTTVPQNRGLEYTRPAAADEPRAVLDSNPACVPFDLEARREEHLTVPGRVRHPPVEQLAGTVELSQGTIAVQQRQPGLDLIDREELPCAHRAYRLERAERVLEVEEQRPHDHEIERADGIRAEVVDADHPAFHRRLQSVLGDLEPETLLRTGEFGEPGGPFTSQVGRPVPSRVVGDVGRRDLRSTSTFHFEREKPIVGADVETSFARQVRPGETLDRPSHVEPAGCDHVRRQLDGVVPESVRRNRRRQILNRHRGPYP